MSTVARRYYKRGVDAIGRSDTEAALEALRSAVDLCPSFVDARLRYAVVLAGMGDNMRAVTILRSGLGRTNTAAATGALWATLGDVLTRTGDFPGALDAYGQAGAIAGFEARAASGKARVLAKQGLYAESVASYLAAANG